MNRRTVEREYCVESAALSDVGLCRSNNQDSLIVANADSAGAGQMPGHLLIVADGMGAHAAGEVASKMAVDTACDQYRNRTAPSPEEALREAIRTSNAEIHNRGIAADELRGMGTTVSSLVLLPREAIIGHVGDSRIYRLRGNELQQLTFDHSLVWEICAVENVMESEVPAFVPRNIITRSVGPTPEVEVDMEGPFSLRTGDVFLLCSDGLTGQVEDEEIGTLLQCFEPQEAAQRLVDLANLRGSSDNVTVIVARVNRWQPAGKSKPCRRARHDNSSLAARIFWPLLVAAGLFGLGWLVRGPVAAISAAVVGAALIAVAKVFLAKKPPPAATTSESERTRLGKAPYTTCDCSLNEQSVKCMAKAVLEVRDVAINRLWVVDWDYYEDLIAKAEAAATNGEYLQSVRVYGQLIEFLMGQLRNTLAAED